MTNAHTAIASRKVITDRSRDLSGIATGVPLLAKLVVNLLEHVSLHFARRSRRIKFAAAVRKIYAASANARLLMSKYTRSTNDSARTALIALEKNAQQPAVGGLPAIMLLQ